MSDGWMVFGWIAAAFIVVALIVGGCAAGPKYNAWRKDVSAKANLKASESEKKIQLVEAQANLESEVLNAKSEVARAKGAAEAIEIEAGKLTPNYIKYLWVRELGEQSGGINKIYVPTEAGLPILEAGKGN